MSYKIQFAFKAGDKKKNSALQSNTMLQSTAVSTATSAPNAKPPIKFNLAAKPAGNSNTKPHSIIRKGLLDEGEAHAEDHPIRQLIVSVEDQKVLGDEDLKKQEKKALVIPLVSKSIAAIPSGGSQLNSTTISTGASVEDSKPEARYSTKKFGLQIMKPRRDHRRESSQTQADGSGEADSQQGTLLLVAHNATTEKEQTASLDEQAITALLNPEAETKNSSLVIAPLLVQAQEFQFKQMGITSHMSEEEKFKRDIEHRPDECSMEDYGRIPVEEFGAALLRGMGWKDGEALGKNGLLEPKIVKRRDDLLGLGAEPSEIPHITHKKLKRK